MPLIALGLILISAVMHASWNLFLKQAQHKQIFIWWGVIVGSLCFAPILIVSPALPVRIWPYIIGSAFMEALYYAALTWAYDSDDFSLTYPLARGTAPVLLVIWTTLFLGEAPRPGGLLGLALLVLGLIVVGSGTIWSRLKGLTFSTKGIIAALAAAICVSIYTAIDGAAVHIASPAPYGILMLGLSALLYAPFVIMRYGKSAVLSEWHINWRRIILASFIMIGAYMLVLQAYALSRISYAGAVREVSVVFAAIVGWLWLGERFGLPRTIGAILIFAGILTIAVIG
jgi:drug/metabolite transporter (DMT)-like permease